MRGVTDPAHGTSSRHSREGGDPPVVKGIRTSRWFGIARRHRSPPSRFMICAPNLTQQILVCTHGQNADYVPPTDTFISAYKKYASGHFTSCAL